MKKVAIYREGNSYMDSLAADVERIILRYYGDEKDWARQIQEELPGDTTEIICDITSEEIVRNATSGVKIVSKYKFIGAYEERLSYLNCLISEARKYVDPVVELYHITNWQVPHILYT